MLAGAPDQGQLHRRWKWFFALGILMVILGFAALANVIAATVVTTIAVGFLLVVGGAFQIIAAFTGSKTAVWRIIGLLLGLLYILVGVDLVSDPLAGAITLTVVVGIMLVVSGAMRLIGAFVDRPPHRGWLIFVGIVDILLGFWLVTNIPMSAPAIGFFVGFELLFAGATWIFLGWAAKRAPASASPTAAAA